MSYAVIGAGVAGLAAARTLADAGRDVVVFEARSEIGGRIRTDRDSLVPLELGAQWIHGKSGNPSTSIAELEGLRTVPAPHRHAYFPLPPQTAANMASATARFEAALDRNRRSAVRLPTDVPLDQALGRHGIPKTALGLRWLELIVGTDADTMSAKKWDDDEVLPGGDLLLPDGYDAIPRALARALEVRLSTPVRAVEWGPPRARVHTDGGTTEVDAVILTIALGLLKAATLTIAPELPEDHRRAIDSIGFGVLNKVILTFEHQFWTADAEHLTFAQASPGDLVGCSSLPFLGAPTLIAWVAGRQARELESRSDDEAVAWAMRTLRRLPGATAPTHSLVTRWARDPHTLGSYSHIAVGGDPSHLDILARPPGPRLVFAGEACSRRFPGTVHGAYLSGVAAAERVLQE